MTIKTFHGNRFQSRFAVLGEENSFGGTLVLIHGFCENLHVWEGFAETLAESYRVVLLDALGHNPVAPLRPDEHFTMQEMADEVLAILDHLGIDKAVFVGHSMGGMVAMHCLKQDLERHAERVHGLCLFHATPFADTPEVKANRNTAISAINNGGKLEATEALLKRILTESAWNTIPEKVVWLRSILNQTPEWGMISATEAMRDREEMTALLLGTTVPMLFILGKEDPIIAVEKMLPVCVMPRKALICLLADVAHAGMVQAPKECLAALRALIEMR